MWLLVWKDINYFCVHWSQFIHWPNCLLMSKHEMFTKILYNAISCKMFWTRWMMLQWKDHESPTKQNCIKRILNLYSLLYYIVMLRSLTKTLHKPFYNNTMLNCIVIILISDDLKVYYKIKQIRKISISRKSIFVIFLVSMLINDVDIFQHKFSSFWYCWVIFWTTG